MNKRWMLVRMITADVVRRKLRIAIAFAAIVIGTAIISGLAGLYYDIGQKMGRELRAYGANLVITPASPETQPYISLEDVSRAAAMIDGDRLLGYVPYLYGVVQVRGREVVIVGTRLEQTATVFPSWKITGTGASDPPPSRVIVGETVAGRLGVNPGDQIELTGAVTGS
ncbi:MAG: ABC transporter permease, partial [Chloroflexota bacterium]